MRYVSVKHLVSIKPVVFNKIEAKIQSGIATIAQKRDVAISELVMDFVYEGKTFFAGSDKVILAGDSGLKSWNKNIYYINGEEFVNCPVGEILGFIVNTEGVTTFQDNV